MRPYEAAAVRISEALREAFPLLEIVAEETDIPGGGATVKVQFPPKGEAALVFSVADQTTLAELSVPQTTSQLMGVKGRGHKTDTFDPLTLRASLYREVLRNDPLGGDDLTGWLSMVKGMPEFPKDSPARPSQVIGMLGYKVTKNVSLFDAHMNRSVQLTKHEVLAYSTPHNVLAQISVDGKTAYGYIQLIDQRFQDGIHTGTFIPLSAPGPGAGLYYLPENEVLEAAGIHLPTPPKDGGIPEPKQDPDAFPLGGPKA